MTGRDRATDLATGTAMDDPNLDLLESPETRRLKLLIYLLPVVGFFPALWTLYRRQGTRDERNVSRLAIVMALTWLVSHLLIEAGAHPGDGVSVPLLLTSSLLTSGYFLGSLWLMFKVWRRKRIRLPVLSRLGDRLP